MPGRKTTRYLTKTSRGAFPEDHELFPRPPSIFVDVESEFWDVN